MAMKCGHISPITKKSILENQFLRYGFLPFVFLIKEFEEEENYEDCQLLYDIVKEKASKFNVDLPTKFNKEAIELFFNEFKNSPNKGLVAFQNIPYYADEIRYSIAGL